MRYINAFGLLLCLASCSDSRNKSISSDTELPELPALLASRFETLDDLKKVVQIEYSTEYSARDSSKSGCVTLTYELGGKVCRSVLSTGVSQNDIIKVRDGKVSDAISLMVKSPFAIANRVELNRIYKLSRRRPVLFGEGDVAFFDLALASVGNIYKESGAYLNSRDSSEKGYLNTFNHITAQAFITSIYSAEMADFVADVHERKNMPELIFGNFSNEQLLDTNNNPVDNYVDLINNELGQTLGKLLKTKYNISYETKWTPQLLTDYINDVQLYYGNSFGIGIRTIRLDDYLILRFVKKLDQVAAKITYMSTND